MCHTSGPAIPSTARWCSSWNIITAPRVISFGSTGLPERLQLVRRTRISPLEVSGGRVDGCGKLARASSAVPRRAPEPSRVAGSPAAARSCCKRRNDAGATESRTLLPVCAPAPVAPAMTSSDGKRTATRESKGMPVPDGLKTSVWSSTDDQRPVTVGVRVGSSPPSTPRNRRREGQPDRGERVRVLVRARRDEHDRAMRLRKPGDADGRAEPLPRPAPPPQVRPNPPRFSSAAVTVRPATAAPATETWSTGVSKRTSARAGTPRATVTQRSTIVATGVRTVRVSRRSAPSAQLSHPGRRTTTDSEIRSPDATCLRGVSRPCETTSGIDAAVSTPGSDARRAIRRTAEARRDRARTRPRRAVHPRTPRRRRPSQPQPRPPQDRSRPSGEGPSSAAAFCSEPRTATAPSRPSATEYAAAKRLLTTPTTRRPTAVSTRGSSGRLLN